MVFVMAAVKDGICHGLFFYLQEGWGMHFFR